MPSWELPDVPLVAGRRSRGTSVSGARRRVSPLLFTGVRLLKDALHEYAEGQGPGLIDWEIALFFRARILRRVGHCFDNNSSDNG